MRKVRVLVAVAVVLTLLPVLVTLVAVWSHGWTMANVETGSMRPGIRPGSLVLLAPVDPATVEVGSIIGFVDARNGGAVTTHRVVEVLHQPTGLYFRTQGDANRRPDGRPVAARDVVGRVRWRIAGLGSLAAAASDGRVQVALVAGPLVALALSELVGRRRPARPAARTPEADELEAENAQLRAALGLQQRRRRVYAPSAAAKR